MNEVGNSARVFIVQEPLVMRDGQTRWKFSLEPVKEFGELIFVLGWSELVDQEGKEDSVLWKIRKRMEGFRETDYILMTGDWTAMVLACVVALDNNLGRIKILQWEHQQRSYRVIQIDLHAPPRQED